VNEPLEIAASSRLADHPIVIFEPRPDTTNSLHQFIAHEGLPADAVSSESALRRVLTVWTPPLVIVRASTEEAEATLSATRIRIETQSEAAPLLVVGGSKCPQVIAKCLESGAHDYIEETAPAALILSRIRSLSRNAVLIRRIGALQEEVFDQRRKARHEESVAAQLMTRLIEPGQAPPTGFRSVLSPIAIFNGDMLLYGRCPSGAVRVLIGDFTGHGLSASLGAIPVADAFHAMTKKGLPAESMLREIDKKLTRFLPPGVFFATALIEWKLGASRGWNFGVPDLLVHRHGVGLVDRVSSQAPPLGIRDVSRNYFGQPVELELEDTVFGYTDGLAEAEDVVGQRFGTSRVEACFTADRTADSLIEDITAACEEFRKGSPQSDDMTLFVLPCLQNRPQIGYAPTARTDWRLHFDLGPQHVRELNVRGMVKRALELDPGLTPHLSDLYLVLSELLENAICHGLLGLRSESRPKSFDQYLEERRRGLEAMTVGRLTVDIERTSSSDVILRIEDSGPGFNAAALAQGLDGNVSPSGRGISLVRAVCAEVRFHGRGNMVEAVYRPQLSRPRDDGGSQSAER